MKLPLTALLLAAWAGTVAVPSWAQSMKPGLWEVSNRMQSGNHDIGAQMAQMQKQMASMPPEQRKMMEEMMAKQGVSMPTVSGDGAVVSKVCMTKEMVDMNAMPIQNQGDCTSTRSPMMGNKMKVSFVCTNPPSKGEGEVTFAGDSAYTMKMTASATVQGKQESMSMNAAARFLHADCGSIKPMPMPRKGK